MPLLVVRVHGLDGNDWNLFARNHSSFLEELLGRYDASLELRLKVGPTRDYRFVFRDIPDSSVDGWFEFAPRDPDRADHLARELADRFKRIGGEYAHAVVSVCVVRFRVHHSYGG